MAHAIRMHATGGPEVLVYEEIQVGDPGPGEARIRQTAIGLNYIDTYHRSGLYPLQLPTSIGSEAAGVVEAVGSGVTWLRRGDRVAYSGGPPGAYATDRVIYSFSCVGPHPHANSHAQVAHYVRAFAESASAVSAMLGAWPNRLVVFPVVSLVTVTRRSRDFCATRFLNRPGCRAKRSIGRLSVSRPRRATSIPVTQPRQR